MKTLHKFEYLQPSADQIALLAHVRMEAARFANVIEDSIDNGPDKTYLLRKFREVVMWANFAIVCNPDGSPRS